MSFIKDFKAFALKGNVIDLAVAVVIGAAFSKVVNSIVADIIMPVVGVLTGGMNFSDKKVVLTPAHLDAAGKVVKPENALTYGNLIQATIDFIIVAFAIFLVIRAFTKLLKRHHAEQQAAAATPPPAPAPTLQEKLLMEIRDELKNRNN